MSAYSDALSYLYSFTDLERVPGMAAPGGMDLGKVHRFFDLIGRPERAFGSVIIAGTKGKGSTASYVAGALRAAGYRTGLYTQPHLTTFRERIQVDGELLPEDRLAALLEWVRPYVEQMPAEAPLTTYEISTALALRYFSEERVEYAVLEIGLGGRLDAVNAVRAPLVSVITSLSLDHSQVLGDTIAKIAFEKAGIIRPDTPVVSAPQPADGLAVIRRTAAERAAPLYLVGEDILVTEEQGDAAECRPGDYGRPRRATQAVTIHIGSRMRALPMTPESLRLALPLLGHRQAVNAAAACSACLLLAGAGATRLTQNAIAAGFKEVTWPGRLETVSERPLLVLDGAHNGDSADQLAADLAANFCYRRLILVLGAMADKQVDAILRPLLPLANTIVFTQAHHPRAMGPGALMERAVEQRPGSYRPAADVRAALDMARGLTGPEDCTLVTGSLYIVGEARAALGLGAPPDRV